MVLGSQIPQVEDVRLEVVSKLPNALWRCRCWVWSKWSSRASASCTLHIFDAFDHLVAGDAIQSQQLQHLWTWKMSKVLVHSRHRHLDGSVDACGVGKSDFIMVNLGVLHWL